MNCKGFESTISLFALAYVCALTMVGCKPSHDSSELNEQLLSKFDEYPLVALGEDHGWIEESELVSSLINDPLFPQKVNDVVIECGNARFQPLVDDYVNGEPVPDSALQQTWRNMTVLCTCDAPVYAQLFRTVKEVNQKLPSANRIRILLGEPPLDWSKINKAEELGPWIAQRDQHYSDVVEKEVIRKNRKALLIMGSLHFIKAGWGQFPQNDHADPNSGRPERGYR